MLRMTWLRNNSAPSLHTPPQQNLEFRFIMPLGNLLDSGIQAQIRNLSVFEICCLIARILRGTRPTQRAICNWHNVLISQKVNQTFLWAIWVELYLITDGFYSHVAKHVKQNLNIEIGNSKTPSEPQVHEFFKFTPEDVHWFLWLTEVRCRPVNEIEINVLGLKSFKWTFKLTFRIMKLWNPNLSCNEDIFPLNCPATLLVYFLQCLSDDFFILIQPSSI